MPVSPSARSASSATLGSRMDREENGSGESLGGILYVHGGKEDIGKSDELEVEARLQD